MFNLQKRFLKILSCIYGIFSNKYPLAQASVCTLGFLLRKIERVDAPILLEFFLSIGVSARLNTIPTLSYHSMKRVTAFLFAEESRAVAFIYVIKRSFFLGHPDEHFWRGPVN